MNVILMMIDTLRADHLSCYGYHRPTSPNIDAFAARSVFFERHFATSIPTHPAFTTLLSGQHAITHGVVAHGAPQPLPRTIPWLPAVFQKGGYTTCAIDNLAQTRMGFLRGFEFYIDPSQRQTLSLTCDNREINRRAVQWIEAHRRDRFFLMMHYWDPHTPYMPPPPYRRLFYSGDPSDPENPTLEGMERHPLGRMWRETWFRGLEGHVTDAEYIVALYDGEIRYCDEGVGAFLDTLDRLGLADDTLVVLLSDHGEMMYRHGIFFDHHGLYDGNLHVPFLVRHPGIAARRITSMTTHVDVAATLLACCGLEAPAEMEGEDLTPWMRGAREDVTHEYVVSQECTWQMKWSLRTDTHKFILSREEDFYGTPPRELYDLREDPDELRNIVDHAPELACELEARLEAWIGDGMTRNGLEMDPLIAHGLTLGRAWKAERAGQTPA
ncbi:MAG TPA: sulfatase [Candidatus Hydrogenedentes bacterium]|nr:sulfatase [Candidatus Hydrogenedentota bacterium]HNT86292.1 sulfatase [Candidatus Hydrogenedentota bacterium]